MFVDICGIPKFHKRNGVNWCRRKRGYRGRLFLEAKIEAMDLPIILVLTHWWKN